MRRVPRESLQCRATAGRCGCRFSRSACGCSTACSPDSRRTTWRRCCRLGPIDVERLERAIRGVVARHEILRSRFVLEGDALVVRFAPPDSTSIVITDLRDRPEDERMRTLEGVAAEAAHLPFDLAVDAPVRFRIFQTGSETAALLISAHHIALDSWSFGTLGRELRIGVRSAQRWHPTSVARPPVRGFRQLATTVDGPPGRHRAPRVLEGPVVADCRSSRCFLRTSAGASRGRRRGETHEVVWPAELYDAVRALTRQSDATLYMVLLAAMAAVLHRHTGQTDLAIGCPLGRASRRSSSE